MTGDAAAAASLRERAATVERKVSRMLDQERLLDRDRWGDIVVNRQIQVGTLPIIERYRWG